MISIHEYNDYFTTGSQYIHWQYFIEITIKYFEIDINVNYRLLVEGLYLPPTVINKDYGSLRGLHVSLINKKRQAVFIC